MNIPDFLKVVYFTNWVIGLTLVINGVNSYFRANGNFLEIIISILFIAMGLPLIAVGLVAFSKSLVERNKSKLETQET